MNNFFKIIEHLKINFLEQLSVLLEHQINSNNINKNISCLEQARTQQLQEIFDIIIKQDNHYDINYIKNNIQYCNNIQDLLNKFHKNQEHNVFSDISRLKDNLYNLNEIFNKLFFEHTLIERQINFLKVLVLIYSKSSNLQQIIRVLLKNFNQDFPCLFVSIYCKDEQEHLLHIYYMKHVSKTKKLTITKILKKILYEKHNIITKDNEIIEEILFHKTTEQKEKSIKDLQIISVPLLQAEGFDTTKILAISCATLNNLSEYELDILQTNLSIMGISLNTNVNLLADSFIKIKHYANHDPLTGLYNRRYFDNILNYEFKRAKARNNKFSILMIDLDDFKNINDSYGHAIGDITLKTIADVVTKLIRRSDLFARIGGDEFAIILMNTLLNQAMDVAERIRKNIKNTILVSANGDKFHISVSIGVSSYPEKTNSLVNLISNVDQALYKAKSVGKDSIFSWP